MASGRQVAHENLLLSTQSSPKAAIATFMQHEMPHNRRNVGDQRDCLLAAAVTGSGL